MLNYKMSVSGILVSLKRNQTRRLGGDHLSHSSVSIMSALLKAKSIIVHTYQQ